MRPALFSKLIRMAECQAAGRIAEFNRVYTTLPVETRGVMALLDYCGAHGDLYTRSKGLKNLRSANTQDQAGADGSLLRRVAMHQLKASEPKEE